MRLASLSGVRPVAACSLALAAAALGFFLQNCAVFGQDALESLPSLQQEIISAAAKARPSVVRVIWRHHDSDDCASGVILTPDGYVATFVYMSYRAPESRYDIRMPAGESVSVYLADGRRLPGVVVGSFSSAKELNFDLVKITEDGVWPCATIGRAEELNPGETCLALGFPPGPGGTYEREASVRIGHLIPWGAPGLLRSSCLISGLDDRGGGLFDLEGRLIGIHLYQPYSDYQTRSDPTTCHLDIKVVEQNWRSLTNKRPPTEKPSADRPAPSAEASQDAALPPIPSPDAPELAVAAAKAREATVALATGKASSACSGTIVTPDGYIATCAHHHLARGTRITVYFADGRAVPATILGRDDELDIGLAKITAPGPWPCAALGKTTHVKAGDSCIIAGYPNYLRKEGKVPVVVRGARVVDTRYAPTELLSSCRTWNGDSGGGLFDGQGRLIGVHCGPATPREVRAQAGADAFATLWDLLVTGPALGDPVPFEASPAAAAMRKAIAAVPPIVCEVLGVGKRRALGTIVSEDGRVLTKASELYGNISCRLADGRILPAAVRHVSREHDLALLKIEATGLPRIVWSSRQELPVGTLVAALSSSEPPAVGVVSYPTHKVDPAIGYLGIGKVKDADGGIEVEQLQSWWNASSLEQLRRRSGMSEFESPIRIGDIVTSIEGRRVPNVKALEKLTRLRSDGQGRDVPSAIAGDPVCVTLLRDGKDVSVRFPLLYWDPLEKTSPRCSSFPAVFDTDARLAKDACGGPLVDCDGQVVGITIALPVSLLPESPVVPRVFVVPAFVARAVANQRK